MVLTLNNKSPDVETLAQVSEGLPQVSEVMETISPEQVLTHARQDDPALLILQAEPDSADVLAFLQDLLTVNSVIRVLIVSRQPIPPEAPLARLTRVHLLKAPFNREGAATLLAWLLDPAERAGASLFRAQLRELRLLDILQIKAHNGSSCSLRVISDDGANGTLHFREGRLVHAATRAKTGKDAFHDICMFRDGLVEEGPFDGACPTTMVTSTHEMIMNAARFMDERMAEGCAAVEGQKRTAPIPMTDREIGPTRLDEVDGEVLRGIPKLLIIDDSSEVLLALQQMLVLALRDYAIITSASARSALEWATTYRPELIVLDYFMPGMNGDVFCERLQKAEGCAEIPIVLISGQETVLEEALSKIPTVRATLRKPFTGESLVTAIQNVLALPV